MPPIHVRSLPRRALHLVTLALALAAPLSGCARLGDLGGGAGHVLADDSALLPRGDLAATGPHPVVAAGLRVGGLPVALYRPADVAGPAPSVVFLPGLVAPENQYESYARALASRGVVVAVRGLYGPFLADEQLAADARALARWLVARGLADPARIGVAGHSRGGKDAILAAARDPIFSAVVALDPDDQGALSVVRDVVADLRPPLLLIGAEVAWKASRVCAPKESNYQRFFERAPKGTVQLCLRDADHVQVMDDPTGFGYGICRCGGADNRAVRVLARRALVAFFVDKLATRATAAAGGDGRADHALESLACQGAALTIKTGDPTR